jgi:transcriptional regulator with XRE-family HTH domain
MDANNRRELAKFLRSRRERITPAEVGLPAGPRRRAVGLRREEVAVLAGLSPTWYTYLEQERDIKPSREVLDSLARVLRLTEDERRYVHNLAFGTIVDVAPLDSDLGLADLVKQIVAQFEVSPYPVYGGDQYGDVLAWNEAACEWYEDWGAMPPANRNILRWLLSSPQARTRLVDWESVAKDSVARWRTEYARHPADRVMQQLFQEFSHLNPSFATWWNDHEVMEHRSALRRFRHPRLGVQSLRIVPLFTPETVPTGIILHLPWSPPNGVNNVDGG